MDKFLWLIENKKYVKWPNESIVKCDFKNTIVLQPYKILVNHLNKDNMIIIVHWHSTSNLVNKTQYAMLFSTTTF